MADIIGYSPPPAVVPVSGQTVSVSSGVALASGAFINALVSGTVSVGGINISGEVVEISGQTVVLASGAFVNALVSGTVQASISGDVVKVSGETVVVASGAFVNALVSGTITASVSVSGDIVEISGQSVQLQSGTVVERVASQVRTGGLLAITNASGGTALPTASVVAATIVSLSGNSDMFLGGGTNPPYSGFGFWLAAGASVSFSLSNLNEIRVFAETSGQLLSFVGIDL